MGCKGVYISGTCYHDEMSLCQVQPCNVNEQISHILSKAGFWQFIMYKGKFYPSHCSGLLSECDKSVYVGPELCIYFKMYNFSKIVCKLALISFFKCLSFMFSTAMTSHRPTNEPRSEKIGLRGFLHGPTQSGLCSH